MTTAFLHHVPREDLAFGIVRAEGVQVGEAPSALASALDALIAERKAPDLDPISEARRKGSRDVLRNGRYKPTGRGKPASEYLLRAAREGVASFPRINGPVDANNLVSLKYLFPISIWDVDRAGSDRFEMRLGRDGERYVFNTSGQVLDLRDLVCGCALHDGDNGDHGDDGDGREIVSQPIVTPIKDGMATKIVSTTTRLAGVIYVPLAAGGEAVGSEATAAFAAWLSRCGDDVHVTSALLMPGGTVSI